MRKYFVAGLEPVHSGEVVELLGHLPWPAFAFSLPVPPSSQA
jgi:hypothetical protein